MSVNIIVKLDEFNEFNELNEVIIQSWVTDNSCHKANIIIKQFWQNSWIWFIRFWFLFQF